MCSFSTEAAEDYWDHIAVYRENVFMLEGMAHAQT